jgi:putative SOS response-associated peptidase YedK
MVITDANSLVAQYHDRMPVLLDSETMTSWMSGEAGHELLKPATETVLKAHPVSRRLNNARVGDSETLIQPVEIRPATVQPDFLL